AATGSSASPTAQQSTPGDFPLPVLAAIGQGACKACPLQVGALEACRLNVRSRERGPPQIRSAEIRALDVAPLEADPAEVRAPQADATHPGGLEDGALQGASFQRGLLGDIRLGEVALPGRVAA